MSRRPFEVFMPDSRAAMEATFGRWDFEALTPAGEFLRGCMHSRYSQFGEEGLLQALFAKIGTANRWCLEVGAADGVWLSNTRALREQGWQAVLIEADAGKYADLLDKALPGDRCHYATVDLGDLDRLLTQSGAPLDLDLGVLDVDGQEWHLWESMQHYRPRVMLVEFSSTRPDPIPPWRGTGQAGLCHIVALGQHKGYVPLCRTNVNALLVREDVWQATNDHRTVKNG